MTLQRTRPVTLGRLGSLCLPGRTYSNGVVVAQMDDHEMRMPAGPKLNENSLERRSSISVSGAAHYDALGKFVLALEDAGVEPSFECSFAMLELAYLNLRATGVPAKGAQAIVAAIECLYEGSEGLGSPSRAN